MNPSRLLARTRKHAIKALTPAVQAVTYELLFRHGQDKLFSKLVRAREIFSGKLIRLEASSVCQLRCPACSISRWRKRGGATKDGEGGVIGWGLLRYQDFARLLKENPAIRTVELSNWGEIFLNPELIPIMRLAHERGVKLRAVNGVNFNRVSEETLRALVDYRFGPITVSIDGATHESYKRYRRVMRHIRYLERYKDSQGARDPKLTWQFIVFGHNEHEIELARELAAELKMNFRAKLNHTPGYSPVQDPAQVRALIGGPASREEFFQQKRRAYSRPCTQLWTSPQINWDGKLLGCWATLATSSRQG
ncbi:MAG: radical SAM protein [Deltaproteobacteria bacterium]|nr:radical SAM protein [Deltaproteobacteria bacterium]